jgi:hypothetical protein
MGSDYKLRLLCLVERVKLKALEEAAIRRRFLRRIDGIAASSLAGLKRSSQKTFRE